MKTNENKRSKLRVRISENGENEFLDELNKPLSSNEGVLLIFRQSFS